MKKLFVKFNPSDQHSQHLLLLYCTGIFLPTNTSDTGYAVGYSQEIRGMSAWSFGCIRAIKGSRARDSLMLKAYIYNGHIYDRYTKTIEMAEKAAISSIL